MCSVCKCIYIDISLFQIYLYRVNRSVKLFFHGAFSHKSNNTMKKSMSVPGMCRSD